MGNILFIIWRESLEAILVITILHSFLKRETADRRAFIFMWSGVGAGLLLSLLFALMTLKLQDNLTGDALNYFETVILLFSAGLMTQMVMWMNKHGRAMKRELEKNLSTAMTVSGLWGAATVSALAIAREGAETVVYLYGMSLENSVGIGMMFAASFAGLGLAFLSAWTVARGFKFLNYATFFKVTTWVLLFSAAGLLVNGVNRLLEMEVLPTLVDPIWNTSWLLDGNSTIGGIVAVFTGYRPRPSLMLVILYTSYWIITGWLMKLSTRQVPELAVPPMCENAK